MDAKLLDALETIKQTCNDHYQSEDSCGSCPLHCKRYHVCIFEEFYPGDIPTTFLGGNT